MRFISWLVKSFPSLGLKMAALFCSAMAKIAKAYVYALLNESQTTGLWPYIPYGKIDGFEGKFGNGARMALNELTL